MDGRLVMGAVILSFTHTVAGVAADPSSVRREPPDVSIGADRFGGIYNELSAYDMREAQVSAMLSVPIDDRFAVEGLFSQGHRLYADTERSERFVGVQIQQRFRRAAASPVQPFLTYGITSYHARTDIPAGVGECNRNGVYERCAHDAFTQRDSEGPFVAVGFGVHYHPTRFVGVRSDVQLVTILGFPIGARANVSVSIPLGRYRRR